MYTSAIQCVLDLAAWLSKPDRFIVRLLAEIKVILTSKAFTEPSLTGFIERKEIGLQEFHQPNYF